MTDDDDVFFLFFQEVVSTSNSNTVVSLCRLFEMIITQPLKDNPDDKTIHTWIMVKVIILILNWC